MTALALAFLLGTAFGELALLGLWFKGQPPASSTLLGYWTAKKGDVILSAAMCLLTCVAWSEGTIAKSVVDHFSFDLPDTLGVSVAFGGFVSLFAHQILRFIGKKTGLDEPKGD